jgi:hypothetical protein
MTPTFTIERMEYDYSDDVLVVWLDSQHYARSYECTYAPERDHFAIAKHWDESCVDRTYVLPTDEAHAVYRFLDASDDVADAWQCLRAEPAPIFGVRRSA